MIKRLSAVFMLCSFVALADAPESKVHDMKNMKVKITIGTETTTVTMLDNPSAHDFVALMPITLDLRDYNNTEKISDLPSKLSTKSASEGSDPSKGDIAYYAPWGNLAIFYKDFSYSHGLIILGKIDSNVEILKRDGTFKAKFELIK